MTRQNKRTVRQIGKYSASAFHPTAFKREVYAVNFHERGKPGLDRYNKFTQVTSNNGANAIKKARKQLKI